MIDRTFSHVRIEKFLPHTHSHYRAMNRGEEEWKNIGEWSSDYNNNLYCYKQCDGNKIENFLWRRNRKPMKKTAMHNTVKSLS
jgi:hypothetical protein